MGIIDSPQNIKNFPLEWFTKNSRLWITWKFEKDVSIPNSGESLSPDEIWFVDVILQATQFKVVISYWENCMNVFPCFTS
tara:strand:- start:61 stop:300 length:240 start_codon:yes stop_codon:yes gene_type:complete